MSALSDLQGAATTIVAAVQAAVALIQSLQNGTINADDPQVEAVVTQLNAASTALNSAVTPAPAPAPAAS